MTTTRLFPPYDLVLSIKRILAENGFDPPTSGLWAQHASTAPLCFVVIGTTSIVTVVTRFIVPPTWAHSNLALPILNIKNVNVFLIPNSRKRICTVFKKWHLVRLVTVNGPNVKQFVQAVYCCNSSSNLVFSVSPHSPFGEWITHKQLLKTVWLWGGL